jgi:hypothetical protein
MYLLALEVREKLESGHYDVCRKGDAVEDT